MNAFDSIFSKIGSAEVTKRGDFLRDGDYLLEVSEIKLFNGNSGATHVVELIVREAKAKKVGVEPNAVGSKASFVNVLAGKTKDVAPGKIKGFCLEFVGEDVKRTDPAKAGQIVAQITGTDTDPARGRIMRGAMIRAETYEFTSRSGVQGVGVNWFHVPGQTKSDIAARAAAQDGTAPAK